MINYQEFLDYLDKQIESSFDDMKSFSGIDKGLADKAMSCHLTYKAIKQELLRNHEEWMSTTKPIEINCINCGDKVNEDRAVCHECLANYK